MPIVTTYVCDRCKTTHTKSDNCFYVGIAVRTTIASNWSHPRRPQLICCDCLQSLGVLAPMLANEQEVARFKALQNDQPTFDSLLRDLVGTIIDERA